MSFRFIPTRVTSGPTRAVATIVLGGFCITACLKTETDTQSEADTGSNDAAGLRLDRASSAAPPDIDPAILERREFGEAPMLTRQVAAGLLPPVAERLPDNPLVLVPVSEIGRYGGTIRRALTEEVVETRGLTKTLNENLMGYERPMAKSIQLNLAENYEFQDNFKTAIFRIRKGVRWSDGHPFTVDDILFWYYDVAFNEPARENRNPLAPTGWIIGDKPIKMEKVDETTLRISAPETLGRVLVELCQDNIAYPKHFWARFHPRYNANATYKDFRDRTREHLRTFSNGIPRLSAWVPEQWVRGQRIVYKRNPYYWKIDSAGNQLPYADRLEFSIIQDPQIILLKFMNGELDLFGRYFRDSMIPFLVAEGARGTFTLHRTLPQYGAGFYFNRDCPNKPLREAFRNRDVRIALSHAINREEINQILYQGLLTPAGFSFAPSSPYFSESSSRRYSEYDPAKARELLDNAGYRDLDRDGFRELPDGSAFEFTLDVRISQADICELVVEHWKEIGIRVHLFAAIRDILGARRGTSQFEAAYWDIEGAEDPLSRQSLWAIMLPTGAPFWHRTSAREAPDWLWEATDLLKRAKKTLNADELRELMIGIRNLHTDNIPIIAVGLRPTLWGAHNRLGNVPQTISASGVYRGWSRPVMHEQLFIRN